MTLKVASLCAGVGGIDLAVGSVLDAELAWYAQYDPDDKHQYAAQIMAHRFPGVPNHGDITTIDYRDVEPIDIVTAGFPCTDLSLAGKQAGLREGTRSGIWSHVARAIGVLRPSLVIIENVRSLTSAWADSDVEFCPRCMGGSGDPESLRTLRALGAVLGDLSDLGFDAEWTTLPASAVGAPHKRERVVILAFPSVAVGVAPNPDGDGRERRQEQDREPDAWLTASRRHDPVRRDQTSADFPRFQSRARGVAPNTAGAGLEARREGRPGGSPLADADCGAVRQQSVSDPGRGSAAVPGVAGPFVPSVARGVAPNAPGDGRDERRTESARVLRGPDAAERGDAAPAHPARVGQREPADDAHPLAGSRDARPQPLDRSLPDRERERVRARDQAAADAEDDGRERGRDPWRRRSGSAHRDPDPDLDWGPYTAAVRRWEAVMGRPAPAPTEPGRNGPRLAPALPEWMLGLPDGWVTAVPGIPRNAQLRALGNGVVVLQIAHAVRILLDRAGFVLDDAPAVEVAA